MSNTRLLSGLVVACLIFGLLYRLHPLALGGDSIAQFFITEDGYLMLTVARNFAIGNGLSVSNALIATNGVQPLTTFLYAIPYWFTGGEKLTSLVGVILILTAISVFAAWAIARYAKALLLIAKEDDQTETYRGELQAVTDLFLQQKELDQAVNNPLHDFDARRKVLAIIVEKLNLSTTKN